VTCVSGAVAGGRSRFRWAVYAGSQELVAVGCNWSSSQRRRGWLACQPIKRQQEDDEDEKRR
jgi:hypothetical protein